MNEVGGRSLKLIPQTWTNLGTNQELVEYIGPQGNYVFMGISENSLILQEKPMWLEAGLTTQDAVPWIGSMAVDDTGVVDPFMEQLFAIKKDTVLLTPGSAQLRNMSTLFKEIINVLLKMKIRVVLNTPLYPSDERYIETSLGRLATDVKKAHSPLLSTTNGFSYKRYVPQFMAMVSHGGPGTVQHSLHR